MHVLVSIFFATIATFSIADAASLPFSEPSVQSLPVLGNVDDSTLDELLGEELASFLRPGGLNKYVEKRMDDIYRTVARESMGYEVRLGQGQGQ